MKLALAFLLSVVFSALSFAQDDGHAAKSVDIFGDAMTKSSLKTIEDLFADNATVYWVDKKLYGKPQVVKYLKSQLPQADKYVMSFSPDDGLEDETVSTTWGTFAIVYGSGEGQVSNEIIGRYTAVAKKSGDSWQIVSLHLSIARTSGGNVIK